MFDILQHRGDAALGTRPALITAECIQAGAPADPTPVNSTVPSPPCPAQALVRLTVPNGVRHWGHARQDHVADLQPTGEAAAT